MQSNPLQLLCTSTNTGIGTLDLLSPTTWNGANMCLKFLVKQLRLWVSCGAIWLLHKGSCIQNIVRPQLEYAAPIMTLRQKMWRKSRGQQPVGLAGNGRTGVLDELEWPSLEDRRVKSSLTFFYKIKSGTVSLDKDRYLTPAPNLRSTRASHDSQIRKIYGL